MIPDCMEYEIAKPLFSGIRGQTYYGIGDEMVIEEVRRST